MLLRLRGHRWHLRFTAGLRHDGDCDPPEARQKTIRIARALHGERRLAVLLHECLHACLWDLDDAIVEQIADDLARVLWRLGYRA